MIRIRKHTQIPHTHINPRLNTLNVLFHRRIHYIPHKHMENINFPPKNPPKTCEKHNAPKTTKNDTLGQSSVNNLLPVPRVTRPLFTPRQTRTRLFPASFVALAARAALWTPRTAPRGKRGPFCTGFCRILCGIRRQKACLCIVLMRPWCGDTLCFGVLFRCLLFPSR